MMMLQTSYLIFVYIFTVQVISKDLIPFLNETSPVFENITRTENVTAKAPDRALNTALPSSLSNCYGCRYNWMTDMAPWPTPTRTLLVLIDNSTNITSTSTIQLSTFKTNVSIGLRHRKATVPLEEEVYLTYPSSYNIYHGIQRVTTFPEYTTVLNGTSMTSSPVCRITAISYTNVFAVPQIDDFDIPGPELSAFNSFEPIVASNCRPNFPGVLVPLVKIPARALTITLTSFGFMTRSASKNPSPSAKAQIPVVSATDPVQSLETPHSDNASPKPIHSASDPPPLPTPTRTRVFMHQSIGPIEPSNPYDANGPGNPEPNSPSPTSVPPAQVPFNAPDIPKLNSLGNSALTTPSPVAPKAFGQSASSRHGQPELISPTQTQFDPKLSEQPVSRAVITKGTKLVTENPFLQFDIDGKTLSPGGSAIQVDGTPISLAPFASHVVIGDSTVLLTSRQPMSLPRLTLDGSIITANSLSQFVIDRQTLRPAGPEITVSGTPISLGPSATHIVISGNTVKLANSPSPLFTLPGRIITPDSESRYLIGGQTLIPGSSIFVSGTLISLAPSASKVVIGSSTLQLLAPSPLLSLPYLTVGDQRIEPNSASQYIIDGQTLAVGSPAIIVSGTPISLAPSALNIVIGGSTIPFATAPSVPHALTFGGKPIFPNSASEYIIGSQTIIPGAQAVTISGTPISLAASATNIVIGGIKATLIGKFPLPPLTIDGTTLRPNSASEYLVGSQTLIPGASAITISGTRISLAPSASALILGSKTIPLISGPTALPLITIGKSIITPNAASQYIIASQTLLPGGPAITVSGTRISLAPSASAFVLGSKTIPLAPGPITAPPLPMITIGNSVITPNAASQYIIADQTLLPGGPAITISGTRISFAPSAAALVLGSKTVPLAPGLTAATALPLITIGNSVITPNAASQYIVAGQTLVPGGPAITVLGTRISLVPSATALILGSKIVPLAPGQTAAAALPLITIGNSVITPNAASQYIIGGQTLVPGGPAITLSGTRISLAPSATALVLGSKTVPLAPGLTAVTALPLVTIGNSVITPNAASQYIIGGQTLVPGGPAITVSGTRISLAPSATALVLGSKTVPLAPGLTAVTALPLITIGNSVITPNAASQYIIAGQTLVPGGPAITVSGMRISLAPSASSLVLGSKTIPLALGPITAPALPLITIGNSVITPNAASQYIVAGQTLVPGGPAITLSGTRISLAPSASALILGSKTIPLTSGPTALPLITIGNSVITPNAASQYIIAGQTLVPGGPAITVSGTRISLAPQATDVVVGTSTEELGRSSISGTAAASIANGPASATGPAPHHSAATRAYHGRTWIVVASILLRALWS